MFGGKALSIFCISHPQRGCFRPQSIGFKDHRAGELLLISLYRWELRSRVPATRNRLELSQKQRKDVGLIYIVAYHSPNWPPDTWNTVPKPPPPHRSHLVWKTTTSSSPHQERATLGDFFLEECLMLGIGHWYALELHPVTAFSVTVSAVNPTGFFL